MFRRLTASIRIDLMNTTVTLRPLTADAFAAYGDVIERRAAPDMMINQGRCERHHDLARLAFGEAGKAGISLFYSQPVELPVTIDLMERHPLGSQAFLPMSGLPWMVVVAGDNDGQPGNFEAWSVRPDQGINLLRNTWHAVLLTLERPALFAVVDRIGGGDNLEVHTLDTPLVVTR